MPWNEGAGVSRWRQPARPSLDYPVKCLYHDRMNFQFVDGTRLISVVEALIFSSPDPIAAERIAQLLSEQEEELRLDADDVERIVHELNARYDANDLAFRIERIAGGYSYVTQPRFHPWMSILQHEHRSRRLSQSALETLAIIAYRQPITKPEIDQIRGVDSGYVVRQLMEKSLIRVSGRESAPGKPLLYKTSEAFLRHFGINHVDELPRPREIDEILKDDDMAEHRQALIDFERRESPDPVTETDASDVRDEDGVESPQADMTDASKTDDAGDSAETIYE
jgi:segregation and condensation protein B